MGLTPPRMSIGVQTGLDVPPFSSSRLKESFLAALRVPRILLQLKGEYPGDPQN